MPTARITKTAVDAIEAGARDVFLWDDELKGLGLRTTKTGAKSYVFQYRLGGREAPSRRYTIGRHGSPWTPQTARKEAERIAMMVGQGIDPVQAEQERRRQAVDLAFESYVESFVELYLKKRWKQWPLGAGVLRREAVPVLGRKPLTAIRRSDIAAIWDHTQDRPAIARLTHATLRKMLRWAVSRGDLDRSPLEGVEAPPPVPARERVLSDDEIPLVWAGCGELGFPFGSLLRMLVLTGQRREEVASLDWKELNRKEHLWTMPSTRTKNKRPHLVPLSDLAIEIFDEMGGSAEWPKSGFVFSTTGRSSPSGFSKAKRRLDESTQRATSEAGGLEPWRLHDLRRTVATGLQRLGVRFEVTEAVLNHVSGSRGGIAGIYQRHDWKEEKKDALSKWSGHVERLVR